MRIKDFNDEIIKLAATTQPNILEALEINDPTTLISMTDELTPKYTWGAFAHPLEILAQLRRFMTRTYGLEWTEWEPETITKFVTQEFGPISNLTENKIWSLQAALTTDAPWLYFDIFENCALAWTNQVPLFGVIQPLDLHELAFCVGILDAIRTETWDSDVLGYMAATLQYNGVLACPASVPFPEINSIIQRQLSEEHRTIRDLALQQWDAGFRANEEPSDVIEMQLLNFQILQEWYDAGRYYEPAILKRMRKKDVSNNTLRV